MYIHIVSLFTAIIAAYYIQNNVCIFPLFRYFISKCIPLLSSDSFNGHGIWTISLLVYTYLFHTSVTTLLCPTLPDRSGTLSLVCFYSFLTHLVDCCFHISIEMVYRRFSTMFQRAAYTCFTLWNLLDYTPYSTNTGYCFINI